MRIFRIAAILSTAALTCCDLAPIYRPPNFVVPASYQGSGPWQLAHPQDTLPRGDWWTAYSNPTLDDLEAKIPDNPDLLAEQQAFQQARDLAAEAEAGLYPQIGLNGNPSQNRQSVHRLFRSPTSTAPLVEPSVQVDAAASWEIDLWDRIGNEATSRKRLAQAEAANLASLRLSLQAELANAYITLRGLDQQAKVYQQTASTYQTALNITQMRLSDNIGSAIDVDRAQTQLSSARALLQDITAQRALAQHAIATLVGQSASTFTLPPQQDTPLRVPQIPAGIPSALLQRRPDIAAAERAMAAANAEIGVARAAFYPNISLSGLAGMQDSGFNLVSLPNAVWSIGSAIALPLFEGGLRRAELDFAKSAYTQTCDQYRSVVLVAFQQVEDQLSLNDLLAKEAKEDRQALSASSRAQALSLQLYTAGAGNFLDVVVAQVAAFQAQTGQVGIDIRVQQASVNLIRALGGGWSGTDLPTEQQIRPFNPLRLSANQTRNPSSRSETPP